MCFRRSIQSSRTDVAGAAHPWAALQHTVAPAPSARAMTTPVRRRWRLLRRGAWYALAAALVLLALGNGIASQLLPLVERHPDKVAAWLGARVRGEVAFDHVETEWTRRGPLLRLDNLRIGDYNPGRVRTSAGGVAVVYTHLTLPTICSG